MTQAFSQEQHQPGREKRKHDSLEETLSRWVAYIIHAHPNRCFDNALDTFLIHFPQLFLPHGTFIEGWYVVELEDEVVLNEHGWCERADGTMIDPTVILLVPAEQPVFYFPGVERSWQEVHELFKKKDVWFPYVRCTGIYGADGLGHPAYNAAYEAAKQKVFSLAHAVQPPKRMTFLSAQDLEEQQQEDKIQVQLFIVAPDQAEEGNGL